MNNNLDGYMSNNNLSWIRLVLSTFVIIRHSYILVPTVGAHDVLSDWVGFTNIGALAVKIFFFVSGLLVCNSLINNNSPVRFFVSRFFRIVPALFVLLLATVFIVGPLVTSLSLVDYFKSDEVFVYLYNNLNLFSHAYYNLPGVFNNNAYPNAVNGSLWTLTYEVEMYSYLLALSVVGLLKRKMLASIILGFVAVLPVVEPSWL
ncbi:MAG: acyltransferase family protein, partial [Pseudoalteromonas tetraodonis]|nr:acyltransferase family protein [Pseudoalteromonas tetraodonis]